MGELELGCFRLHTVGYMQPQSSRAWSVGVETDRITDAQAYIVVWELISVESNQSTWMLGQMNKCKAYCNGATHARTSLYIVEDGA